MNSLQASQRQMQPVVGCCLIHDVRSTLTHGTCRDLADAMGLDRVDPDADPRAVDAPFALYDGSQFVINQSDWTLLTMLRMGMRYGTAPLRFDGLPQAFFKKFFGIYALQVGRPSLTLTELCHRSLLGKVPFAKIWLQAALYCALSPEPSTGFLLRACCVLICRPSVLACIS